VERSNGNGLRHKPEAVLGRSLGRYLYRVVDGHIVELTCIGETDKMKRLLEPMPPTE
jgi:hypothetical protein